MNDHLQITVWGGCTHSTSRVVTEGLYETLLRVAHIADREFSVAWYRMGSWNVEEGYCPHPEECSVIATRS